MTKKAMTKDDVKGMADLAAYARERLAKSVRRNDPVAAAYWAQTERYAEGNLRWRFDGELLRERAREAVALAQDYWKAGEFMNAALVYAKAKWLVIIGRNLGFRMPPPATGVNLGWLRALTARRPGSRPAELAEVTE